jgi:hypothetical protein
MAIIYLYCGMFGRRANSGGREQEEIDISYSRRGGIKHVPQMAGSPESMSMYDDAEDGRKRLYGNSGL